MAQADQAQEQAQGAVHTAAVAASTALNKLAQALRQAGADTEDVKAVDEMSNTANSIASAAVGNAPQPDTNPAPGPRDPLEAEMMAFRDAQGPAV